MKTNFLKITVIVLILAGCLFSCGQEEERERKGPPCNPQVLERQYPWSAGNPLWVFEMIGEWLENEVYGSIIQCNYRDGWGYMFVLLEVSDDYGYIFKNCEGEVLYEGKSNPMNTCPELNIEHKWLLMSTFPYLDSDHDGDSDQFLCHVTNPFTLPKVKEMLYNCNFYKCEKRVSICNYKDGVGFLLREHIGAGYNEVIDFLDCSGNLLFNISKLGVPLQTWCPELNIDLKSEKILLKLYISLSYPNH